MPAYFDKPIYNLHVEESTGLHVVRYHFPGSEEVDEYGFPML